MSFVRWSLRCIPGLATFALIVLLECALKIVQTEWLSFFYPPFLKHSPAPVVAQGLFISYSIFLHILALLFPLRLCASAWAAAEGIRARHGLSRGGHEGGLAHGMPRDEIRDTDQRRDGAKYPERVIMAIVLPSYKEDIEILETSLRVLASHSMAKSSYDVQYHRAHIPAVVTN